MPRSDPRTCSIRSQPFSKLRVAYKLKTRLNESRVLFCRVAASIQQCNNFSVKRRKNAFFFPSLSLGLCLYLRDTFLVPLRRCYWPWRANWPIISCEIDHIASDIAGGEPFLENGRKDMSHWDWSMQPIRRAQNKQPASSLSRGIGILRERSGCWRFWSLESAE